MPGHGCLSFLNRALGDRLGPYGSMATHRGNSKTRGTNFKSAHGPPVDLLDRIIIISTESYNSEEIKSILTIRAQEEEVELHADALAILTKIGEEASLRYAANLVATANLIASKRRSNVVEVEDVKRSYSLFLDVKRSVQYLGDENDELIASGMIKQDDAMEVN